jgi:hypothetical protein
MERVRDASGCNPSMRKNVFDIVGGIQRVRAGGSNTALGDRSHDIAFHTRIDVQTDLLPVSVVKSGFAATSARP